MKKSFVFFLVLFLGGSLMSQNINFRDTNGLKVLLCSKMWIRYYINTDSTFLENVMDSIKFYSNGTFYKSGRPQNDTNDKYLPTLSIKGNWFLGSTSRTSRSDTATNCIQIVTKTFNRATQGTFIQDFVLIDGHRIKGTKNGKRVCNIDEPLIEETYLLTGINWNRHLIWQPRRKFKNIRHHSR